MRALMLALVAAVAGCYAPTVSTCDLACTEGETCPDGLTCGDGFCRAPGDETECEPAVRQFELTVTLDGPGTNRVVGPSGLDCPGTCTVMLDEGVHRLTAETQDDSRVVMWSALGCDPTEADCNITLDADATVGVTFGGAHTLRILRTGDGRGAITGVSDDPLRPTFSCTNPMCDERFGEGTTVTLTKINTGVSSSTWGDACIDENPNMTCVIELDGLATASADFRVLNVTLLVAPSGQNVKPSFDSMSCTGTCQYEFAIGDGSSYGLMAELPDASHRFVRWVTSNGGGCDGDVALLCNTSVEDDLILIALFERRPRIQVTFNSQLGTLTLFAPIPGADLDCPLPPAATLTTCTINVDKGSTVNLKAGPNSNVQLSWGNCPSQPGPVFGPDCDLIDVQDDRTITLDYVQGEVPL